MKKKDDNQMNEKFQNFLKEGFASDEEIIAPHRVKGKQNKGAIGWITNKLKRDIAGPVGGDEQPIKAPDCKGGTSKEGKWTVSSDGQYTYGLDSPTNPESLVNMLKKVGLEDEQVQQLIMKICGLASDEGIALEEEVTLSGSNSEKDRILRSKNVQHLINFIKGLDLDADKNNQLLKILNIWGKNNTVKFDSTGGRRSSSSDERPAGYDYKRAGTVDDSEEEEGETGLSGGAVYHCDDAARESWNDQQKKQCAAQAAAAAKEASASDTDDNRAPDIDPSAEKPATTDAEKALQKLADMRFPDPKKGPEQLQNNYKQFRESMDTFGTLLLEGVSPNNETPGIDNRQTGDTAGGGAIYRDNWWAQLNKKLDWQSEKIVWMFGLILGETVQGAKTPGEAFDQLLFIRKTDEGMIKKIKDNFVEVINKQMDYLIEAAIVKMLKPRGPDDPPAMPTFKTPYFLWLLPGIDKEYDLQIDKAGGVEQLKQDRDKWGNKGLYRRGVMASFEKGGLLQHLFNPHKAQNKEFTIDPKPFSDKALKRRLGERTELRAAADEAAEAAEKAKAAAVKNETKSAISPEAQALIAKRKKKGKFIPLGDPGGSPDSAISPEAQAAFASWKKKGKFKPLGTPGADPDDAISPEAQALIAKRKAQRKAAKFIPFGAPGGSPDSAISPEAQAIFAKKKGKFKPYFEESQNNQKIKEDRLHESYRREKDEEIYAKLMEKFLK